MSSRQWTTVWMLAFGLLATAACGDKKAADGDSDEEGAVGPATGSMCDASLTFNDDIAPLMTKYCVSCHAKSVTGDARHRAPTDHNFDSEQGLANEAVHADEDSGSGPLNTNTRMPPVSEYPELNLPVPTLAERVTLSKWLACQM